MTTGDVPPQPYYQQGGSGSAGAGLGTVVSDDAPSSIGKFPPVPAPPATQSPRATAQPRQFRPEDTADPGYFKSLRRSAEQRSTPRGQHVKTVVSILSLVALFTVLFFVGKNVLGSDSRDRIRDQEVFEEDGKGTVEAAVPSVTEVSVVHSDPDAVTFTWTNPNPQSGDYYVWRVISVGQESQAERVTEPEVAVPTFAGQGSVCIEVSLVRENGKASPTPTKKCS